MKRYPLLLLFLMTISFISPILIYYFQNNAIVPLNSTSSSTNSIVSNSQQGNPHLNLKAIPHRVVYQHNTLLEAKLTYHGELLEGKTINFYLEIDQDWEFIGTSITNSDGIAEILYFVELPQGHYDIKAEFLGDAEYNPVSNEKSIRVLEESLDLTFNPITVQYSDEAIFQSQLVNPAENPIPNRNITFSIYLDDWIEIGTTIKTDKDGFAILPVDIYYSPGTYHIKVTFKGGKQYGFGEEIFFDSLTILKETTIIPTIIDFTVYYGDIEYLYASLTDDENIPIEDEELIFLLFYDGTWNEIGSARTDSEGYVLISYTIEQDPGVYPLKIIHEESDNCLEVEKEGILIVEREKTMIYAPEIRGNYGDLVPFMGRLTDDDLIFTVLPDKLLTFYLEPSLSTWNYIGEVYTDESGWAYTTWTIDIPPGGYNTRIDFDGDFYYEQCSLINSPGLVVEREIILLSDPSKVIYQGQPETIATVVTDDEYNPIGGIQVDFYISGSSWTYLGTATSDSNGIAAITTTLNLAVGTYDLKVFVAGTAFYKPATTIGIITIQPAAIATDITLLGGPYVSEYRDPSPDTVTIKAKLMDGSTPLSGKTIKFYYDDAGWQLLGQAVTDSSGVATLSHSVTEAVGEYGVKAEFEGDATHDPDSDEHSASSKLGYVVISENAFAPWYERLTHSWHYNDAEAEAMGLPAWQMAGLLTKWVYHWYLCEWASEFYFNWETYYYYNYYYWRDNHPTGFPIPSPNDPCYIHEFRSYTDEVLEARLFSNIFIKIYLYATNLPGDTGMTDAGFWEEMEDECEEVEIYTKNPELLQENQWYQAVVLYRVDTEDAGHMVSEAELGEETGLFAWFSPPGYPMKYITLTSRINFPGHSDHYESNFAWIWDPPLNATVNVIEYPPYRKVTINGINPTFGEIDVAFEIDSSTEVTNYINMQIDELEKLQLESPNGESLASITFKNLVPISECERILEEYNLTPILYRYESESDGTTFTGQILSEGGWVMGDLTGIYRMDVLGSVNNLYNLQNENSSVLLVDPSYHQMLTLYKDNWFGNITIDLDDFYFCYKKYHGLQNLSLSSIEDPPSANGIPQSMVTLLLIISFPLTAVAVKLLDKRRKLQFGYQ